MRDPQQVFSAESVAAAAGVSKRSLFNHFGTLEELRAQVCIAQIDDLVKQFETKLLESAPLDSLDAVLTLIEPHLIDKQFCDAVLHNILMSETEKLWWQHDAATAPYVYAFGRIAIRLAALLRQIVPSVNAQDRDSFAVIVFSSIRVAAEHWYLSSGKVPEKKRYQSWKEHMVLALERIRTGYGNL